MSKNLATSEPPAVNVPGCDEATLQNVLGRIADLTPLIREMAPGIERTRRLPVQLVSALTAAGIYSMLVPRRHGGLELPAAGAYKVLTALSRVDGSAAWSVMTGLIGSLMPFMMSSPRCAEIYRAGRNTLLAGSGQPAGTAERVPGGWKVSGTWPLVSGCHDAQWLAGTCVMMDRGAPIPAPHGHGPLVRCCVLPADQWEIRDTWHAFGLRGTDSQDIALQGAVIPEADMFDFPFGISPAPEPVFKRVPETVIMLHGAFAVGVAEGAIKDLVQLARTGFKQQFVSRPLVETDRFKERLAQLDADLMAARALLEIETARFWSRPGPPAVAGPARVARQVQTAIWITAACLRVVEGCYQLAGVRAVYESSPLQQRLRDMHVATQHVAVHPRGYVQAGNAVLAGL